MSSASPGDGASDTTSTGAAGAAATRVCSSLKIPLASEGPSTQAVQRRQVGKGGVLSALRLQALNSRTVFSTAAQLAPHVDTGFRFDARQQGWLCGQSASTMLALHVIIPRCQLWGMIARAYDCIRPCTEVPPGQGSPSGGGACATFDAACGAGAVQPHCLHVRRGRDRGRSTAHGCALPQDRGARAWRGRQMVFAGGRLMVPPLGAPHRGIDMDCISSRR